MPSDRTVSMVAAPEYVKGYVVNKLKSGGVILVFPSLVCRTVHVQFVIYVCLRMVVSNTYCVVLLLCFVFVLCTLCCQFLWIVHCYCLFCIL